MKTIIVPLDGSALSERVLPYVRLLAQALRAHVLLLQIVAAAEREYPYTRPGDDADTPVEQIELRGERRLVWDQHCQHVAAYLEAHARQLRAAKIDVSIDVQVGAPADGIVETASSRRAAMIAMATHGHSGLLRWALGSVADQVAHTTSVPVLLVRGATRPPVEQLRRILVPLDGSERGRQALGPALDLAIGAAAELIVLRLVAPSIEELIGGAGALAGVRAALGAEVAQAYAARAGRDCGDAPPVTPAVTIGRSAAAIVAEAERRCVDLIVMAAQDGGARRWLAGSLADSILHETTIPLLLVRS